MPEPEKLHFSSVNGVCTWPAHVIARGRPSLAGPDTVAHRKENITTRIPPTPGEFNFIVSHREAAAYHDRRRPQRWRPSTTLTAAAVLGE